MRISPGTRLISSKSASTVVNCTVGSSVSCDAIEADEAGVDADVGTEAEADADDAGW